jgi:hypothetical protein
MPEKSPSLFDQLYEKLAEQGYSDVVLIAAKPDTDFSFALSNNGLEKSRALAMADAMSGRMLENAAFDPTSPFAQWLRSRSTSDADSRRRDHIG